MIQPVECMQKYAENDKCRCVSRATRVTVSFKNVTHGSFEQAHFIKLKN